MAIVNTSGKAFTAATVDLSDHLVDVEFGEFAALADTTVQGIANQTKRRTKKGYKGTITLLQDMASASVHDTVQAWADADGGVAACAITWNGITYTGDLALGDYMSIPSGKGEEFAEIVLEVEAAGVITLT